MGYRVQCPHLTVFLRRKEKKKFNIQYTVVIFFLNMQRARLFHRLDPSTKIEFIEIFQETSQIMVYFVLREKSRRKSNASEFHKRYESTPRR